MNLEHNQQHVVDSLINKLAQAELRASQFEAVVIAKEQKIQELQNKLNEKENDNE